MQRISESVRKVSGITTQIVTAAEEQTHVTGEINKNLHHISDIGQQSAAGAKQTAGAAQTLAEFVF